MKWIIVAIVTSLALAALGLFTEISVLEGERVCAYCKSRQAFSETNVFIAGLEYCRSNPEQLDKSQFLKDFPEYICNHSWESASETNRKVWDSPILVMAYPDLGTRSSSVIPELYEKSEEFRNGIRKIIEEGIIPRARVIDLAYLHCMDGGMCQLDTKDNGDRELQSLIYRVQR